jgi:hypothetical protein
MAKKSATSAIETELLKTTGLKQGPKENRQAFLKKLSNKVNDMADEDEKVYDNLTPSTQDWVNAAIAAEKKDQDYPDFDWQDPVDAVSDHADHGGTPHDDNEADLASKKDEEVVSTKKTAKKTTVKKTAEKPIKAVAAPKKPVAAKPAAKPKAAKANGNGNGKLGATAPWRAILKAIAAKGDKGVDRAGIFTLCEKNEVAPMYARFVTGGYLKRVSRGVVAITPAGEKFLAAKE